MRSSRRTSIDRRRSGFAFREQRRFLFQGISANVHRGMEVAIPAENRAALNRDSSRSLVPRGPAGERRVPQVFPRSMNVVAKVSLFGSFLLLGFIAWVMLIYGRSSYGTGMGLARVQPIPFSHQHHVGILGIDCRYCHTTVESSSFAGMPPTKTCMNCHSQIWVGSEMLAPVRDSYRTGQPLRWPRVNNLPGFVYFDHSIHMQKGVGCTECHGRIDRMPFTFQEPSLLMEWCLDCHRNPEKHLRPREYVVDMKYQHPDNQKELGRKLVEEYGIRDSRYLTSCTVCHR
jgi:hypothetical protein